MSLGAGGQMIGQVFQHKSDYRSSEQVALLHLHGKLYCRAESLKPKPFITLNPVTLEEEEKEEFELEKEDKNLEWKTNEETGRSLTYSPLFSDGNLIYVISQRHAPKPKGKFSLMLIRKQRVLKKRRTTSRLCWSWKHTRLVPRSSLSKRSLYTKTRSKSLTLRGTTLSISSRRLALQPMDKPLWFTPPSQ